MSRVEDVIRRLKLKPHAEGGYYRETFRDETGSGARAHSTAIYFLLRRGEESRWHRIDAAEVWHFYAGAPLELFVRNARERPKRWVLGPALSKKEQPQIVVPAGKWQRARSLGAYTLAGCTVAPGFLFDRFELE